MKRDRMSLLTALFALCIATLWLSFSGGHFLLWLAIALVWLGIAAYQWKRKDAIGYDPAHLGRRISRLLFWWT